MTAPRRRPRQPGQLDAGPLELTAGSSLLNPMYLFTGDAPVREFAAQFPAPARVAIRLAGSRFLRSYPYQEAYLLDRARQFRAALNLPLILSCGARPAKQRDERRSAGVRQEGATSPPRRDPFP